MCSESRFANHSCWPNCGLFENDWANTTRLGIFATPNIPPLKCSHSDTVILPGVCPTASALFASLNCSGDFAYARDDYYCQGSPTCKVVLQLLVRT
ncbi:hypothetical protein JG687_00007783 [Phytophthora cactorum]|uniref:SET domain-containing protein n=1 Tax=Phytophthora cactorum TaxID=29920 RepID=A0A8T1UE99_9STRA|nr:hypothetical protein JG687_00007783 [Phytophthora cactorum]